MTDIIFTPNKYTDAISFFGALVLTFVLTAIAGRILIPILKSHKMGQKILDIGPRWHKSKEGTPTMGGLTFIIASLIVLATVGVWAMITNEGGISPRLLLLMGFAYANALIGFLDDYVKFFKKQNEGLSAKQKYLLQLIAAAAYLGISRALGLLETALYIPYLDLTWEMGWLYYLFAILLITGIVNSVNLTDGLDGLASSVTLVVGIFMAAAAYLYGIWEVGFVSAVTIGACAGFLVYNFYPAKVFMGDTGSLFFGALTVGMAFALDHPLIIVICGFIYILESASVILQVGSFKLTGKRIFKMAPIHHHFEKCGWSELKVVGVFTAVTLAMSVLAYFGL